MDFMKLFSLSLAFSLSRNYSVNNCRQYEEKQLAAQQEKTQKILDFEKQEGRLKQQVS